MKGNSSRETMVTFRYWIKIYNSFAKGGENETNLSQNSKEKLSLSQEI